MSTIGETGWGRKMKRVSVALWMAALLAVPSQWASAQKATQQTTPQTIWSGSWAAAPIVAPIIANASTRGTTYRDVVHLSLGGNAVRLHISNEFGPTPLAVASVHVALSAGADRTQAGTDHAVTFGGAASVTIPAGAAIVSDPIPMPVQPFAGLAVSIFVSAQSGSILTYHALASSTNYIAAGDETLAAKLDQPSRVSSWYLLKSVDVDTGAAAASVVTFGASITDGYHSTPDRNARWPDVLAARLQATPATSHIGVLNEGIGGNRLLHDVAGQSAVARLDRDVLAQCGAKYVIVAIGTNDIGRTFFPLKPNEEVTAEEMMWGYRQIVARAHARGIKVFGSTLNPFGGADYFSPAGEQMRQAVNSFVKTSGAFDGFIDFDKATRDPAHPETLLPAYDSGDHLHPNDAGYKAMADAIDLKLFTK
jgi:lysophospholipase L1-like esterase